VPSHVEEGESWMAACNPKTHAHQCAAITRNAVLVANVIVACDRATRANTRAKTREARTRRTSFTRRKMRMTRKLLSLETKSEDWFERTGGMSKADEATESRSIVNQPRK